MTEKKINYLCNPRIEWTITDDGTEVGRQATGKWEDWEFSISAHSHSGWNIKVNGIQAWTYMRGFHGAMASVGERLRGWAYINQFRK